MRDVQEILSEFDTYFEKMKVDMPETARAFSELIKAMYKEGALKAKDKELISLGISIVSKCESCIVRHVKRALDIGTTKEEIMSVCAVAVSMGGGPALAHIPIVMKSIERFVK